MTTRYTRPFHSGEGAFAGAWYTLPALLLAVGLGFLALVDAPETLPSRAETGTELTSLPPAA